MIKTAVIGASGFLGRHLLRSYRQSFPDCVGTACSNMGPGLTHFDLRKPDLTALRLEESGHKAVLIASAKPNIAFCEQQPAAAYGVNVTGTLELLRQIGRTSMAVIFLSSDYVFEGTRGNYTDADKVKPTTAYGRHKAIIEREIPSLVENFLILRLSKMYGLEKNDGTLLCDLARSFAMGEEVMAAADQFFCPTEVTDLVRAIVAIQERETRRVLNVCCSGIWSRYEIARALAEAMSVNVARIKKISLHEHPAMKGRPLNTSMQCSRLENAQAIVFAPLHDSIKRVSAQWTGDQGRHREAA
jgi:dTDP-4-dehydrorhamnose reductase